MNSVIIIIGIIRYILNYVACATILRFRALLCQIECATFVHALAYCNFLKEVRLGGWGQTRKCVRYYTQVACASVLGCIHYYIRQRAPPFCANQYIVTSLKRLDQVAGARHARACATLLRLLALLYQVAYATILCSVRHLSACTSIL